LAGRLSSYRFRRRLLWTGSLLAAVAIGVTVSVLFWNTGPLKEETFSGGKANIYVAPEVAKLTKDDRAEIVAVAKRFFATAVTRDDPGEAFELAGPSLRTGTTRESWESGEIPVVPFPVDDARWRFDYSYVDEVGLEVYAWPEPEANLRPMIFMMSLVAVGAGENRHWLVDSIIPRGGSPAVLMQRVTGSSSFDELDPANQVRVSSQMSAAWLLALPGALVLILILVPVVLIAKNRRIARRAARS
jgi:hypothetical protein